MRPGNIHPDDDMYTGDLGHYERCGEQFGSFVKTAADLSGAGAPRILELPCGYGRVTRHLVKQFAPGQIDAADIMSPCIEFVRATFGVRAIQIVDPVNEFANIQDGAYDVAAMGSLITHLSEPNTRTVVEHFLRKLSPNGVAVITTHGQRSRDDLHARNWFEVSDLDRTTLLDAYAHRGHGFVNYSPAHTFEKKTVEEVGDAYGVSLTHKDWMTALIEELGYSLAKYTEGGWDNHQDVYFIRK